jgi:hypothetical protein
MKAAIKVILPAAKHHQRAPVGYFLICEELEKGEAKVPCGCHINNSLFNIFSCHLKLSGHHLTILVNGDHEKGCRASPGFDNLIFKRGR